MDAPSGVIGGEGRELFEERPNSQGSHTDRRMRRAPLLGASRQAANERVACVLACWSGWPTCRERRDAMLQVERDLLVPSGCQDIQASL